MSNSKPDPAISTVGLEQEPEQLPLFTLTRPPGASEVVLRTGDGVPLSLPLVSKGDFTLYEHEWFPYHLQTVPPAISFLLSSDPPSSDESLGATAYGSFSFDHGRAEESITVTYDRDEVTMTWLHLFSLLPGYHPVVKLLLHQGADPEAVTSPFNQTPLHLAGTDETATLLIDNGAEVNARDKEGQTPVHLATQRDRHSLAQVLLDHGADPDIRDSDKQTPLHLASTEGHHSIAGLLLDHGADPNITDSSKQTPLHLAALRDRHSIVELLLAHGADVLATDRWSWTPLSKAKTEEVILAIILHTKDLDRQDQRTGNTLLHSCCLHGNEEAAKSLIEKGARHDVKNIKGKTALDIARAMGYAHIASHFPDHLQTGRFERDFEVVKDDKHKDGVLGKGAFGRVFKARRRGTDDVFAIKEIHFPPEDAEKTLREVRAAMELSRECEEILTHHDAWLEDRRTSDERTTSTQGGDGHGPAGDLPFPSGSRADTDPWKGSSGEESNQCSSSPGEERSDGIVVGHSERDEPHQANRKQTATTEEGECSRRPSPSAAEGMDDGFRLPQGRDRRCQSQRETSGEKRSSNRPPSLAGGSGHASEPGQDSDQQDESGDEDESRGSSPSSQQESDGGITFEETVEIGQNNRSLDESSETSSPSQEESDDGIRFEETETGQNDPSQDVSSDQSESRQDNQRRLPRGNEEDNDEPPTSSSAQGDGSEGVWTSGAEGGSSTAAEEYLRKCTFTLYIQMDLMEMTLEDYIRRRNEGYLEKKSSALSEEDRWTARRIFWDLCMAVDFVHRSGFIHRDLKPYNVLLSPEENPHPRQRPYSVCLSDFGLSTRLVDEFGAGMYKTVGCGTVSYAAPEQLKGGPGSTSKGAKYGEEVDVYSLALIFVELAMPMSISERLRVFDGLRSPEVRIPREVEESLGQRRLEKVRRGLSHVPTERPGAMGLYALLY
ncbi:unnamed protein product [Cyprideis torosa]|uniref:Uncharacterized protein n=1 Tax=Cyprideis torosa TaxID=163714 RepID=A0A7R8WSE2_9CRUS|nr:unnamed protein product [Cyprideis torosa]CAG0904726.1 unnamed protein product [Cyprideis torosa]